MFMRTQAYYLLILDVRVVIISKRTFRTSFNNVTDCKRKALDKAIGAPVECQMLEYGYSTLTVGPLPIIASR